MRQSAIAVLILLCLVAALLLVGQVAPAPQQCRHDTQARCLP